jgi:hypothetical protein
MSDAAKQVAMMIIAKRKGQRPSGDGMEGEDGDDGDDGMDGTPSETEVSAAEDLMAALEEKDPKALAMALKHCFDVYDQDDGDGDVEEGKPPGA